MAGGLVPTLTQKLKGQRSTPKPFLQRKQQSRSRRADDVPSRPAGNTRQEPRDMTAFRDAYKERAQNGFDDDPFEGG